jgi:hypothetical protein
MTLQARQIPRGRPRLTIVRGCGTAVPRNDASDWRRMATAVLSCTQELMQHLVEQRWGRVVEALSERRELLGWLARMPLDSDGHCCVKALRQAADESENAIAAMMGLRGQHQ